MFFTEVGLQRKGKKESICIVLSLKHNHILSLGTKILTAVSKKVVPWTKPLENELNIMLLESSHPFHLNCISDNTVS